MPEPDGARYLFYDVWRGVLSECSTTVEQTLSQLHDSLGKGFPGPGTDVYTCSDWRIWVPSRRGGPAAPNGLWDETLLGRYGVSGNPQVVKAIEARLARGEAVRLFTENSDGDPRSDCVLLPAGAIQPSR